MTDHDNRDASGREASSHDTNSREATSHDTDDRDASGREADSHDTTGRNRRRTSRRTVLGGLGAGALAGLAGAARGDGPGLSPVPSDGGSSADDAPPGGGSAFDADELLVGVAAGHDLLGSVTPALPTGATVVDSNETLRFVAVGFPDGADAAQRQFADAVTARPGVKYVEDNSTYTTSLSPNDPEFGNQYAPQLVDAPGAWNATLGSSAVTIAVVDTGVQYSHPDLQANFRSNPGRDFVDNDSDPEPDVPSDEFHGTHVAGIIGAATDNATGVAGISDCELIAGRALDETGSGTVNDIANAVQWAAGQGAQVVNLSLGGGGFNQTLKNAVSHALMNGCLPVAAAGNGGTSGVSFPASFSECLAVSAVDRNADLASFSNTGPEVELTAPGVDVLSTTTTTRGSYEQLSGTSMATPVVTGTAGLVESVHGNLTPHVLRDHLKGTADDLGTPTTSQGCGLVHADAAVSIAPGSRTTNCAAARCGNRTQSGSLTDSLSGSSDSDCWAWSWFFTNPCEIVVELSGPSGADFDLYVNERVGSCPTTTSHTRRSITTTSNETIRIVNPDTSADLYILVDSFSGSGSYTLSATERGQ